MNPMKSEGGRSSGRMTGGSILNSNHGAQAGTSAQGLSPSEKKKIADLRLKISMATKSNHGKNSPRMDKSSHLFDA